MKILYVIPARGGSKGIPGKNIKSLNGKPLIEYSIDAARQLTTDENICVSTDDIAIKNVAENYGLNVPFMRPDYLATDKSGSNGVILHAYQYYVELGRHYDAIVLLQPTSPFRLSRDIQNAIGLYSDKVDMVVSVKEATTNPYYNSYEVNEQGYLHISKGDGKYQRRQDVPKAYEFNGAVYVINPTSLIEKGMENFDKILMSEMDEIHSLDLDTLLDWHMAEIMIKEKMVEI
jgi:N-acylneuraminate cytidylyltransferase